MQCWVIRCNSCLDYLAPLLRTRTSAWYILKHYVVFCLISFLHCLRLGFSLGSASGVSNSVHRPWVLPFCSTLFIFLVNLLHGQEHSNEYIKTRVVRLLTWCRWHERLPPRCLSEEPCEALLSRVVTMMRRYATAVDLEGVFDIFLITPRPKMDLRDLRSHIPKGAVPAVDRALADMVRFVGRRPPPYFPSSGQATTVVPAIGALVCKYPVRWQDDIPLARRRALIIKTMHTLLEVGSPELLDKFGDLFPPRPARAVGQYEADVAWFRRTHPIPPCYLPQRKARAAPPAGAGGVAPLVGTPEAADDDDNDDELDDAEAPP